MVRRKVEEDEVILRSYVPVALAPLRDLRPWAASTPVNVGFAFKSSKCPESCSKESMVGLRIQFRIVDSGFRTMLNTW